MEQNIQIKATDEDLKGRYANMVQLTHTKEEFVFNFINGFPAPAMLVSRIMLNPAHAKRLAAVLDAQLKAYETAFGKLEASEAPKSDFGFKTN